MTQVRADSSHRPCSIRLTGDIIKQYIQGLKNEYDTKMASEFSYRVPLREMLKSMSAGKIFAQIETTNKSDIQLFFQLNPKRLFSTPFGTIETKTMGKSVLHTNNLSTLIKNNQSQIADYLKNKFSIIFTNYLEFGLLQINPLTENIECTNYVQLISPDEFLHGVILPSAINCTKLEKLFQKFINQNSLSKSITTQKMLACRLASSARDLAEVVVDEIVQIQTQIIHHDIDNLADPIYVFYTQYKHLTRLNTPAIVANAFGQTVACGLFLAKLNLDSEHPNTSLTQNIASANIPHAVPVIKELFRNIENTDLSINISKHITQIIDTLNQTDIDKIRKESPDIFLYFYEEFLKAFDQTNRTQMGVYYTPIAVVNYICDQVNTLLKQDFGKSFGFGDADIRVLDPATGTGTFLARAIDLAIKENLTNHNGGGGGGGKEKRHRAQLVYTVRTYSS